MIVSLKSVLLVVLIFMMAHCDSTTVPEKKLPLPLKTKVSASDSVVQSEIKKHLKKSTALIGTRYPFLGLLSQETGIASDILSQRVVILNFSFSSCRPCILELDGLKLLYEKLKDNKNALFISITPDDSSTSNEFVKQYNLPYTPIPVKRVICSKLNFENGYPTNIILKAGTIKKIHSGGFATKQQSSDFFNERIYHGNR
ncbi:peroxiredoxin family protein [Niabella hirudinis]|uniref:peroxiredoxin family protein n=1 Tax=Niabella hirudinis TaxID=1285929 RepID=UPI003EBF7E42